MSQRPAELYRKEKMMPFLRTRNFTSAILAVTLLASSAASAAPAPNKIDPYVALSLSGSAVAAETAVAQGDSEARGSMMPLWVALGVVFAGWAWILLDNDDDDEDEDVSEPISP